MKSHEASPLYVQIKEDIRFKIQVEEWKVGDTIPPELDLCKLYNVSRITVRRAIDELVKEDLLYRERAKGTYVLDWKETEQERFTLVKSFTKEMEELGKEVTTIKSNVTKIKANKKLATLIHVDINDDVLCLKRVRGLTGTSAFAYFITYIPYKEEYSLDDNEYYGSFYEYLSKFGIYPSQAREYIEAVSPTPEVQSELKIDENEPILKRVRMMSQKETGYNEYSECYYIGSKYRYYIDFTN